MSTWNKIAEAFGRALSRPDIRNEMNTFGKNSKQGIRDRRDLFDLADKKAIDNNAEEDFFKGLTDGEDDKTILWQKKYKDRNPSYDEQQKDFDDRTDQRMNDRLEQNASDEWDEAFARRKQGVHDWYGKDYPQDMAEEGAEAFEKQLWDLVDELKAKGVSAQDILNRIKGND